MKRKVKTRKTGGLIYPIIHYFVILMLGCGGLWGIYNLSILGDSFLKIIVGVILLALLLKFLMKFAGLKDSDYVEGTIFFFIANSISIIVPGILFVMIRVWSMSKNGLTFLNIRLIIGNILLLIIISRVYENLLRTVLFNGIFAKYYVIKNSFIWISLLTIIISAVTDIGVLYYLSGNILPSGLSATIILFEIFIHLFYLRGVMFFDTPMDFRASRGCRVFLNLLIFYPLCFFKNVDLAVCSVSKVIFYQILVSVLIFAIYMLTQRNKFDGIFYEHIKTWNIPEVKLYTIKDFKKQRFFLWQRTADTKLSLSIIISIAAIAMMFIIHGGIHYLHILPSDDCSLKFVREYGIDFIMTLISCTFLIVSFLSFLGDKDDKVLWTDMRTFRLINPPVMNFVGLSVFSFASLVSVAICYFFKYDYLFLISFYVGIFFLTYLTFLVIISYFQRKETIDKLSLQAIASLFNIEDDFFDWNMINDDLLENTEKMIDDKNWSKVQENFDFLISIFLAIRITEIKNWINSNGYKFSISTDSISNSFYNFLQHYDYDENPLFLEKNIKISEDKNIKIVEFDFSFIEEELIRFLSLLDFRAFKLLLNRNKKSVFALKEIINNEDINLKNDKGESISDYIDTYYSECIKKDLALLNEKSTNRKITERNILLPLSIGDLTVEFRKKGLSGSHNIDSCIDYFKSICSAGYQTYMDR